jgi:hypothetical protein
VKVGSQLTNQDVTGPNQLATIALYPSALAGTVPTISGASSSLFMCHGSFLQIYVASDAAMELEESAGDSLTFFSML